MKKYKIIDLFAGVGGFRLGFENTKRFETVFSSEIDKIAAKVYEQNFGDNPLNDITTHDLDTIPDHDVLVGGFPCQPFSQIGMRNGIDDERGTLINNIIDILLIKSPPMFVLENVPGIKTDKYGNTFDNIIKALIHCGYNVTHTVLNSVNFGVPQHRNRVFIFGVRKELRQLDMLMNAVMNLSNTMKPINDISLILEADADLQYFFTEDQWETQRKSFKARKGGFVSQYKILNKHSSYSPTILTGEPDHPFINTKSDIDGPAPTMYSSYEIVKDRVRRLTVRECARLQGFPDTFKIAETKTAAYHHFGNAVNVKVVEAIAEKVAGILDETV